MFRVDVSELAAELTYFVGTNGTHNFNSLKVIRHPTLQKQIAFTLALGAYEFEFENTLLTLEINEDIEGNSVFVHSNQEPIRKRRTYELCVLMEPAQARDIVLKLCEHARSEWIKSMPCDSEKNFSMYSYDPNRDHFVFESLCRGRSFDSIILDDAVKTRMLHCMTEFTSEDSQAWFKKMQIPNKEGWLLHGPPGTGKTSTIAAIASELKRDVYQMSLATPKLTDTKLRELISSVENGLIVFEDFDVLFNNHREKAIEMQSCTFSGVLNALDGLGNHRNILFIMTTNHPERLDPAMRRKGRIDHEFELGYCTKAMTAAMFRRFYDDATDDQVRAFVKNVFDLHRSISPAMLQHHFIVHRRSDAEVAATHVQHLEDISPAKHELYS